jgi:hypothetical protein
MLPLCTSEAKPEEDKAKKEVKKGGAKGRKRTTPAELGELC